MKSGKQLLATAAAFAVGWGVNGDVLLEALAQFETGATKAVKCDADSKVGKAGEVSRYQIKPVVWHKYAKNKRYNDPATAKLVATAILDERMLVFVGKHGRNPSAYEIYILWNAPDYLIGTRRGKVIPVRIVTKAMRYENLVEAIQHGRAQ